MIIDINELHLFKIKCCRAFGSNMLYASSKSALNSLVNSAIEYFDKSKIHLKIINPKTFGGKHLGKFKKKVNEDINKVVKLVDKYISKS